MIKAIKYEDIIKVLGKFLDTYSGIKPDNILNADSIRGTDISEMISESQSYSPSVSKSFVLFELLEDENGEHFATSGTASNQMITIQTYNFHLMIYGNSAPTDAQKISAIFKQADDALELHENGVFVKGVSPIEPINEFINNTLLLRRDLNIKIEVKFNFNNIGKDVGVFDEDQEINMIVKSVSNIN